jgi:hypothetical protein
MPERTLETVVWCSACRKEIGRVYRVPAENHDVYQHVSEPEVIPKACPDCGEQTGRKP